MPLISFRPLPFSLLTALLLVSTSLTVSAQQSEETGPSLTYWVFAGPGLTSLGAGGSAGFGVEFGGNVLSVRGLSTEPDLGSETWEVALLYSRAFRQGPFLLSAGAGAAVVGGTRYGGLFGDGPAESMETQMGFPLEGTAIWAPIPAAGIGLHGYVNVNTGHPFGGIGLVLRVGRLR